MSVFRPLRRSARPFAAGLCLAACLALAPPDAAAQGSMEIALELPSSSSPTLAPSVRIGGSWPDSCVPRIQSTRLAGAEIDLVARTATLGCRAGTTAYEQRANPALQAGLLHLPARVYAVRAYLARGTQTPVLSRFALLDATENDPAPAVENGFWWTVALGGEDVPALAGSGISLERQGDQLAVGLFGFDDAGSATWFFGSARLEGRIARVALVRLRDGEEPFGEVSARPVAESGPELLIAFEGPAQAKAWLVRPSPTGAGDAIDVRPLVLQRSAFGSGAPGQGWLGRWVSVGEADRSRVRLFDFGRLSSEDGESFRVEDAQSGLSLSCRLGLRPAEQPPATCTLYDQSTVLAVFDRIGIDRLEGRSADGERLRLVRVAD